MQSPNILTTVKKIRSDATSKKYNELQMKERYIDFRDNYPKLYEAAADTSFPLTFLDQMMIQLNALNNKEIALDDADKIVYGSLQKTYIDPVMSTLPTHGRPCDAALRGTQNSD